jgi:hypothetical protein
MNTDQIKTVSRARYHHALARLNLKEKYSSKLLLTVDGGTWKVTTELISFLNSVEDEQVILIDIYENLCSVDREKLLTLCRKTYTDVMTDWYRDSQQINNHR